MATSDESGHQGRGRTDKDPGDGDQISSTEARSAFSRPVGFLVVAVVAAVFLILIVGALTDGFG